MKLPLIAIAAFIAVQTNAVPVPGGHHRMGRSEGRHHMGRSEGSGLMNGSSSSAAASGSSGDGSSAAAAASSSSGDGSSAAAATAASSRTSSGDGSGTSGSGGQTYSGQWTSRGGRPHRGIVANRPQSHSYRYGGGDGYSSSISSANSASYTGGSSGYGGAYGQQSENTGYDKQGDQGQGYGGGYGNQQQSDSENNGYDNQQQADQGQGDGEEEPAPIPAPVPAPTKHKPKPKDDQEDEPAPTTAPVPKPSPKRKAKPGPAPKKPGHKKGPKKEKRPAPAPPANKPLPAAPAIDFDWGGWLSTLTSSLGCSKVDFSGIDESILIKWIDQVTSSDICKEFLGDFDWRQQLGEEGLKSLLDKLLESWRFTIFKILPFFPKIPGFMCAPGAQVTEE